MAFQRLVLLSIFLTATVCAADESTSAPLPDVPAVVQKTINAQIADGHLDDVDKTNETGETVFEVSFTAKNGDERDFTVADDGTLLSREVSLTETPAAVQKTIRAQAAGWELESVDKNVDDTEISYDVEVAKAGRETSFTVGEDGDVLSEAAELAGTPAAVQTAVKIRLAGGSVKSIDEILEPEGNSFDVVAIAKDGGRDSFSISAAGGLLSEEVALGKISPGARKTVKARIGTGKILRIDKSLSEKKEGVLPYEVQGRKDGRPFDFSVGPRGRFLGMDD